VIKRMTGIAGVAAVAVAIGHHPNDDGPNQI
jgi:hypothetical protein